MATLQYVGKRVNEDPDVVYKDYVNLVKNSDMTVAEIDDAISGGLAGYATVGYVKSQDAKNATKEYVDGIPLGVNPNGGDAARLPLSAKNAANGSCPLDATGKIPTSRISVPIGLPSQKWVRGPWTPPSYFAVPQPITTEATLYSCPVQDPGYIYRLIVFGHLDVRSSMHAEYANFYVREGSAADGQIVAAGVGPAASSETVLPTSGETFGTAVADGLGTNWEAVSKEGDGSSFYKVAGGEAVWPEVGNKVQEWRYRRLGVDKETLSDYQRVRMTLGTVKGEVPIFGEPHRVRCCARMSANQNDWVGFELTHDHFTMQYSKAGTISVMGGTGWTLTPGGASITTDPAVGTSYDIAAGTVNNLRQFLFYRNNAVIGGAVDGNNVTFADSGHRGWGFHGRAVTWNLFQNNPPNIADLLITDAAPSAYHVSLIPANVAATAPRQGSTNVYIRAVRSGALSTQTVLPYKPKLTIFAVPA